MIILDRMLLSRRLYEFINEFIKLQNQETESQTMWEFWLHKVFDMTYGEFLSKAQTTQTDIHKHTQEELVGTVSKSMDIITGFSPFD